MRPVLIPAVTAALFACSDRTPEEAPAAAVSADEIVEAEPDPGALPPADDPYMIVFLGDSLFAGFDLGEGEAVPFVLQQYFVHPQGVSVELVNASRNGGTARRTVDLFERLVPEEADAVLIEFGANDIFSGRTPEEVIGDLAALAERARALGARPILIGLSAPARNRARPPEGIWAQAAEAACADLYPFYFEAVIDEAGRTLDPGLMLPDGLHPNAAGAEAIGRHLAAWLERTLARPAPCAS